MELDPTQWTVLLFSAFMYGFNKTGIVGSAIISAPLLLFFFTPGQSLGIVLPLLVLADVITIILLRHSAEWRCIIRAIPWGLIGIVLGWQIAKFALNFDGAEGNDILKRIIALTLVCLVLFGFYLRVFPKKDGGKNGSGESRQGRMWFTATMGIFGGLTTMLANNGGPAWVVYLMSEKLDKKAFLGTAAWLFFVQNVAKVPFGVSLGFITSDTLAVNCYLIPALVLGVVAGGVVAKRLHQEFFNTITLIIALVGALYLLVMS